MYIAKYVALLISMTGVFQKLKLYFIVIAIFHNVLVLFNEHNMGVFDTCSKLLYVCSMVNGDIVTTCIGKEHT